MRRRVLILEDVTATRESLANMVRECSEDVVIFEFDNVAEAFEFATEKRVDLFLVDIVLKSNIPNDFSGIRFAQNIRSCPYYTSAEIVFITTLAGLEAKLLHMVHCFDYIEKPISKERVQKTIREVLEKMNGKVSGEEAVFLRADGVTYPVRENKIVYIEHRRRTLYVHTETEVIAVPNVSVRGFLEQVHTQIFASPTRGIAVNVEMIEYIDTANRFVKMRGITDLIDIGARMRGNFLEGVQRKERTDF